MAFYVCRIGGLHASACLLALTCQKEEIVPAMTRLPKAAREAGLWKAATCRVDLVGGSYAAPFPTRSTCASRRSPGRSKTSDCICRSSACDALSTGK